MVERRTREGPDVVGLVVPSIGSVAVTDRAALPWVLLDADGSEVDSVSCWLTDLHASDYATSTLRSYAYDLLGWHRFLAAVEVSWRQATRSEVRDWVLWLRHIPNAQAGAPQRAGHDGSANSRLGEPPHRQALPA